MDELDDRALIEGTSLEALTALRAWVAQALVVAVRLEPKSAAGLSRELRAVITEQERLGAGRKGSKVDDLAARRAQRRSRRGTAGPAPAEDPGTSASG